MAEIIAIAQPTVDFNEIASVEEVARYFKVSAPTIRKRIEEGKLRAINFGTTTRKLYRIPWDEVRRAQGGING